MSKKGAVSLPVNALVVIVLSLFIMGAGISLLFKFIGTSTEVKENLDAQTSQQIENILIDKGKKLALPLNTVNVFPGDDPSFGLGVLNINDKADFSLRVELSMYVDDKGLKNTGDELLENSKKWLLYSPQPFELDKNEHAKLAIKVLVPGNAPIGRYIFNAKIYSPADAVAENQYGNTQKFTVVVR